MKTPTATTIACLAACLLATVTAHALDETSARKVASDNATWQTTKILSEVHKAAPPDWQVSEDEASGLEFAAPCELQRTVEKQQGLEFPTYLCKHDALAYAVIIFPTTQAIEPQWIQSYWIGHDSSMLARLQQGDPTARLTPVARISYAGVSGRQHRIEGEKLVVVTRLLPSKGAAITMFVAGPKEALPGPSAAFFNAIKLP